MNIWHKMIVPVRRVWLALSARLKPRKNGRQRRALLSHVDGTNIDICRLTGAGLLKLEDDVQTCEYQDVQVMWEMLRRTESGHIDNHHKRKQQPFWRILEWSSNHSEASLESANHT